MARVSGAAVAAMALVVASPAAANPIEDCFQRIAVALHPHRHPPHAVVHRAVHRIHRVHRAHPVGLKVHPHPHPRPHRIAASGPTRAYAHRTGYILKPIACETHAPAVAAMSPLPGAVAPETPQQLLAELAGPAAAPAEAVAAPEALPATGVPPTEFFPSIFGGPGGVPLPGGFPGVISPGVPGGPPVTPPVTPVTPPVETPPPVVTPIIDTGTPPVAPPVVDTPPVIGPPPPVVDTPPTPPPGPPVVPPIVPPVGGVPEPATWGLMLLGFFGLGAALRRRHRPLTSS